MSSVGSSYEGTARMAKLGYQASETVCVVNGPNTFLKYLAVNNTKLVKQVPSDWLQLFCKTRSGVHGQLAGD